MEGLRGTGRPSVGVFTPWSALKRRCVCRRHGGNWRRLGPGGRRLWKPGPAAPPGQMLQMLEGPLPWEVKGLRGRAGRKPPSGIARRGGGLSPPPRPPSHHPTVSSSIASIIYQTSWSFTQVAGKLEHILGGLHPALYWSFAQVTKEGGVLSDLHSG